MLISRYHLHMAQFVVRNIEEDVRDRLRSRARLHGRSMEEEVRQILRAAVTARAVPDVRFGSRVSARFRGRGLADEIPELRGTRAQLPDLRR